MKIYLGWLFILFVILFTLYNSRWIFSYRYEPEYFENWYYHSQWNYPFSSRGISDGQLFKFVGFRIAEGENPFNINFETPPFGKYLYGLAEKYTGNPFWISLAFYLISLAVVYFLAKELFKNSFLTLIALFLLVTTPMVATQVRETMLDLPLMLLYLLHIWLFIGFLNKGGLLFLAGSGIFLGLATGTKIGAYTPLVLVLGAFFILFTDYTYSLFQKINLFGFNNRFFFKIMGILSYVLFVFSGYVLSYIAYFLKHPNPVPWIRLHEKPLKFYLGPESSVDYLNQWRTIFVNKYSGWWEGGESITTADWSLILPLGVISLVLVSILSFRAGDKKWLYICGVAVIFLLVNTIIPFWPRYLIAIIPIFILTLLFILKRHIFLLILLVAINLFFLISTLTADSLGGHTEAVARFFSTRAYRELYRSTDLWENSKISEKDFILGNEKFFQALEVRSVKTTPTEVKISGDRASAKYKFKYITKYGELNYEPDFSFIRKNNEWKLVWDWSYLYQRYNLESKFDIGEGTIALLEIRDGEGKVIARRGKGKQIYGITRLMFGWPKHLNELAHLTGENTPVIDARVKGVIPDEFPRFMGYLDPFLGEGGVAEAQALSGVSLKEIDYLLPLTRHDQTATGLIVETFHKRPELFFIQSDVFMIDNNGDKILIPLKTVEEKDVVIQG